MNKCEWKKGLVDGNPENYVKTGLVFYPCEGMDDISLVRRKDGTHYINIANQYSIEIDFCPFCGAYIRKPEPAEPLIVKSGGTWITYWNGTDYLWTGGNFLKTIEPLFSMTTPKYGQWKSFTGSDPDITELTDEIAKLRPIVTRKKEKPAAQFILYAIDDTDRAILSPGRSMNSNLYRLATAKELQEHLKE